MQNIKLLKETLKKLKKLKETQFYYNSFILKCVSGCPTVCCIAGWIPTFHSDSPFEYRGSNNQKFMTLSIKESSDNSVMAIFAALISYYDLSSKEINYLFFGNELFLVDRLILEDLPVLDANPSLVEVIKIWNWFIKYKEKQLTLTA